MASVLISNVLTVLLGVVVAQQSLQAAAQQRTLSPYAESKAERLLTEKLNCLGCHRLGDEGGHIAPDLLRLRDRVDADSIRRMISDPQRTVPGTIMPVTRLRADTRELLVAYLSGHSRAVGAEVAADPVPKRPVVAADDDRGSQLFSHYCSACHGRHGQGDGFNAPYLAPPPTQLADARAMALRSDAALYDAIATGGRAFGVNHRMPAWGHTLDPADIALLVAQIRRLCACRGPAWSRDDD